MKFAACIRNILDNSIVILPVGEDVEEDDPRYAGEDIHIIPCPNGKLIYGCHDMSRDCACHTKVEHQYKRVLVIHNEKVN